jgi:uncharacterized protein
MKERAFDPRALDMPALCKAGARLEGQWPLMGMERLAAGFSAASDGAAAWSAIGTLVPVAGGEAELWLELAASADVPLSCQRCLQAMTQRLDVTRRFRFVRSEDEALRLDEESEDDVLVLPARLDLHELLEDELILAQPIVPRHDVCPEPLPMPAEVPAEEDEPAPHPFAALAALRGRGGQGGGA